MYNSFKLSNGLRVVVENIDYVKSVSVGLWIENGSRNENISNNGISHFIEHMLFKGTERRSSKAISEEIEDVGGQINAFTGKEATCFYIKALDSHFDLALDILSDMLFNSKFSKDEIQKEKSVILDEISMYEDSPEDVISELHSKAAWGNDSITFPILGTSESVNTFSSEQLLNYISMYYIPENSVISISGKVDIINVENLVNKYFSKWENSIKKVTTYSTPVLLSNHLFKKKEIEQFHISLGIPGIETGNESIYSLLVANTIFGGGTSSILFQKVREELGMCYSIYSYVSSYQNTGIIYINSSLSKANIPSVIEIIKSELELFINNKISEERLLKAKEQLKGSYILGLESTSSRMFSNGKSILSLNKINSPEDVLEKINAITKEKIDEVFERTFSKGIQNSAFVGDILDFNVIKDFMEGDTVAFKNQKSKWI